MSNKSGLWKWSIRQTGEDTFRIGAIAADEQLQFVFGDVRIEHTFDVSTRQPAQDELDAIGSIDECLEAIRAALANRAST